MTARAATSRAGLSALATVLALSVPAASAPLDNQREQPYVLPAGDFDGDGKIDTLSMEYPVLPEVFAETEPDRIGIQWTNVATARRGINGVTMWARSLGSQRFVAPVGSTGGTGVITASGPTAGRYCTVYPCELFNSSEAQVSGGVASGSLAVIAVDGQGQNAWARDFPAGSGFEAEADVKGMRRSLAMYSNQPMLAGVLQATPSPALDVLVTINDRNETPTGGFSAMRALILDGADGSTARTISVTTEVTTSGRQLDARPVGDLDLDGLDDILVAHAPSTGDVTAYSGATGAKLWTAPAVSPLHVSVVDLGDLSGDGAEELAVTGWNDVRDAGPRPLRVLDGATGASLISTAADYVRPVGDLDEDEDTTELLTWTEVSNGVRLQQWAANGTLMGERVHVILADEDGEFVVSVLGNVGDLDADGITDLGQYEQRRSTGSETQVTETVFLSGRTLQRLPLPSATALGVSVDGNGTDLARVRPTQAGLEVEVIDGVTGSSVWTRVLSTPPGVSGRFGYGSALAGDLTGDGLGDVVVNGYLFDPSETHEALPPGEGYALSWAVDGATSGELWRV